MPDSSPAPAHPPGASTGHGITPVRAGLVIGALGVVFGDIGTSPLYALRECLAHLPGEVTREAGILGALSLIFWALIFEVTFKYLAFVTRANNRGEGGVFALLALGHGDRRPVGKTFLAAIVLIGAALLYGDGVITPAISVLGAAEGLESFNPDLARYIPVIACAILGTLFFVQHKGTHVIAGVFGPTMLVWFAVLGVIGAWHVWQAPQILHALNPIHGFRLLLISPLVSAGLLGAVVLAITGAEALYADMGHFGRCNIARAWYFGALPGLVLNYFGQGAWALTHPDSTTSPFFALVPEGAPRLALTGLSVVAAIIASQAMISGVFSLTRQAIQLGYFPRLLVRHTNPDQQGQIYLPLVNWTVGIGSLLTVAIFKNSSDLAGAYGVAVTGTMVITTSSFFVVTRRNWRWPLGGSLALCTAFILFDLAFFGSNLTKLGQGGWFPIAIAVCMVAIMHTWKRGKAEIFQRVYSNEVTEEELVDIARSDHVKRVRGGAVFMAGSGKGTPLVLLHHLKANKVLHETVVLLTIITEEVPSVADAERLAVREIGEGIWRVTGRYGYMESPDVEALMERVRAQGVPIKTSGVIYYFNREMIITGGDTKMWRWQKALYAWMSRNARPARDYYRIEPSQIIEVGLPVVL
jgi:KUP system potassium uptake protein